MKYFYLLFALMLLSCKEEVEVVNIRVNHFKPMGFGIPNHLIFQVQYPENFGTDDWQNFSSEISGFDFEWGNVYELKIEKRPIENPPQDASSVDYKLREVVSKTQVGEEETFQILLKSTLNGVTDLQQMTSDSTYFFSYDVNILCGSLCEEISSAFMIKDEIVGLFKHVDGSTIALLELQVD
ncbi:MAG: DUF4377 domain-containing protein [Cytophagales bacterium]|nr:DUF4377 domain-containing protein [Cytophagales bacterium]